jgi:hypothetical protein
MQAQLTWIDLTATDRARVRQVLDLFNEQGTVDELGLGSLRDALSNALFPGTSVLLTRLRYFLFIPWIYRGLETAGFRGDVAAEARRLEMRLIDALAASEDTDGIIGIQARASLSRLASSAYWASLVRWGIFVPGQSQGWYHTQFESLARRRNEVGRADDPGVVWTREPTWHPRLPPAPEDFPEEASFRLNFDEADFLRGRIEERCGGTLLAWLAREGSTSLADTPWEEPDALRADPPILHILELARRFSLHVEGAPLLYNLMLAERRHGRLGNDKDAELIERYRMELAEWADREAAEEPFRPEPLWELVARQGGRLPGPQRHFVETWGQRIAHAGPQAVPDDALLRRLIANREVQLKGGHRARLVNQGRLLDWGGRVGVGRMRFRWPQVRQLLIDLHQGLAG